MQRDYARQSLAPKRCDQPEGRYPDCSKDWRPCRGAGCCLRFVVKSLSAAIDVLSDRKQYGQGWVQPETLLGRSRSSGLASHGQPRCHRARSLPRPRNLRSPSRCPCPALRSPGKRTSSWDHTWGSLLQPLPERKLRPALRKRTSGAEPKRRCPGKPRPLPRHQADAA